MVPLPVCPEQTQRKLSEVQAVDVRKLTASAVCLSVFTHTAFADNVAQLLPGISGSHKAGRLSSYAGFLKSGEQDMTMSVRVTGSRSASVSPK